MTIRELQKTNPESRRSGLRMKMRVSKVPQGLYKDVNEVSVGFGPHVSVGSSEGARISPVRGFARVC